jgi:hypothetical protein
MSFRSAVGAVALVLAVVLGWSLVPPFPAPGTVTMTSRSALDARFGAPNVPTLDSDAPFPHAMSLSWERSRGVAVWSLRAYWRNAAVDDDAHPDGTSLCFRIRWAPEQSSLCLESLVLKARVMASNFVEAGFVSCN